ncbi:MAG TPA: DUF5658 family protein [Vicinamibacterales bacterium]|jgi:hypothetical protein|nr:DUF5658 family protein [Vicinamibacterales bacterium]
MSRRLVSVFVLSLMAVVPGLVASAHAQDRPSLDIAAAVSTSLTSPVRAAEQLPSTFLRPQPASHPSALMTSLYASTFAMQALDVHSTLTAFDAGAVEANPLMTGVTKNRLAFVALKAGIATSTVLAAHNMAKRNKVAAIATLVAMNSAYAMIVQHNYRVAQRLR